MDQRRSSMVFNSGFLSTAMENNDIEKQQHRESASNSANEEAFKLGNHVKTYGAIIRGLKEVFLMSCAQKLS
jgi:hypothetical protein